MKPHNVPAMAMFVSRLLIDVSSSSPVAGATTLRELRRALPGARRLVAGEINDTAFLSSVKALIVSHVASRGDAADQSDVQGRSHEHVSPRTLQRLV